MPEESTDAIIFRYRRSPPKESVKGFWRFVALQLLGVAALGIINAVPGWLLLLALLGPLLLAGIFGWGILTHRRGYIEVRGPQLIQQGVLRTKTINLGEVNKVEWQVDYPGYFIRLHTPTQSIAVAMCLLQSDDHLRFLEIVNARTSHAARPDWDTFFCNVILPLSTGQVTLAELTRSLDPLGVRVKGVGLDSFFFVLALATAAFGAFLYVLLEHPLFIATPLAPVATWLSVRLLAKQNELPVRRLMVWVAYCIAWTMMLMSVAVFCPPAHVPLVGILASVLCVAGTVAGAYWIKRLNTQKSDFSLRSLPPWLSSLQNHGSK